MMSISVLPGEILYIVFELVDINTWHLQLIRGHALVPVACVCKRWKSIVDKLIYVNLGIRTPNALLRLIDHLSKNGDVTDIVSRTTRRLWSSYADRHAWRSHDSTTIMDKLIALLNMLRALHIVNILFCLPARALSALLDTSGSTIQDLSLVTSSETFNEDSLSKLRNLVRLARLSISFDASSGEDVLPTDMPRIFLPSVETVRLSYPHWWGGCNVLLRAFEFRSLTSVDIKCHRKDIATHLFHAVETFLRRHSETVTELTLSPPNSINVSDLITPLTNLHRLEISSFQLDPSIPAALPSTLSDLRLSLAQTRLDTTTMKVDHQWPRAAWCVLAVFKEYTGPGWLVSPRLEDPGSEGRRRSGTKAQDDRSGTERQGYRSIRHLRTHVHWCRWWREWTDRRSGRLHFNC